MRTALNSSALDRSMVRAVAWNALSKWAVQVLSWASIVVVARLLSPADFGLVGMAAVSINLASLIAQSGLGVTVLTIRDLTRRQIAELNTIALLMGFALFAISCAIARPLAKFFSTPQLTGVVIAWSSIHLINAMQVIPTALLQKELRFKLLAAIESVRSLIQVASVVTLAWQGLGYWSLVYGHVISCTLATALTLCWRRQTFAMPAFRNLGRELQFSGQVSAFNLGWFIYSNADFLIAGRMLGAVLLGDYNVAWNISSAPIEKVGNLMTNITPAYFAAVQHDLAKLSRYVLRLTEVLSYVTVPASIGIALLADLIVPVVLGPKWMGVIGPLRLLGIFVAFRSLNTILPKVLTAIGDTSFVMWNTLAAAVVMPVSFLVGSRWGTNGIAAAWVIMYPIITIPMYGRMFRRIGMSAGEYLSIVLPAVNASALMTAAVLVARWTTPTLSSPVRLMILVMLGAIVYGAVLLAFYRQRVQRLMSALRELRKREDHVTVDTVSLAATHEGF